MQHLGDYKIDDYITFGVQLHRFSSGAVYAPTGNVTYTFYEDNSATAPTGGNLSQLNSKTGLYSARVQLTTANSFEAGKEYFIHVEATVDGVAAGEMFHFRVIATPQVALIDDAITAAKFDESTAFPLKSADTGSTAVARTGADSDTLETLSDEIAAAKAVIDNVHDTDLPAVKTVVDTIQADTDLLDDAAGGIADIHTDIGTLQTMLTDIHGTDLPAVKSETAAIKAKTDNLPASPAAVGSAMVLTAAYDAAKTAATQASVDTIDNFLDTEIAAILADTNELQTDLVNGGRLDLLIDAIKAKTDNLPAAPANDTTIHSDLDAIWTLINDSYTHLNSDLDLIWADTNELQIALTDGGRLDLLIDAVKAKTDKMTYTSGNDLDVNVQKINDVTLVGDGSGTPMGAA